MLWCFFRLFSMLERDSNSVRVGGDHHEVTIPYVVLYCRYWEHVEEHFENPLGTPKFKQIKIVLKSTFWTTQKPMVLCWSLPGNLNFPCSEYGNFNHFFNLKIWNFFLEILPQNLIASIRTTITTKLSFVVKHWFEFECRKNYTKAFQLADLMSHANYNL